jgi:hypothetical protein
VCKFNSYWFFTFFWLTKIDIAYQNLYLYRIPKPRCIPYTNTQIYIAEQNLDLYHIQREGINAVGKVRRGYIVKFPHPMYFSLRWAEERLLCAYSTLFSPTKVKVHGVCKFNSYWFFKICIAYQNLDLNRMLKPWFI